MTQSSPDVQPPQLREGLPELREILPRSGTARDRFARRWPFMVELMKWATGPHPDFELERVRERIQRRDDRRQLAQVRDGRDVCWPEGADGPDPLVTVRIATYSRGREILRTIDSVLAQTYTNLEVLIVGDACDDVTAQAVTGVQDPRVRFLNLPTRGLYPQERVHRWRVAGAHPMNTALALASGAWIAPCDDDDIFTPTHVEHLLEHAISHRLELAWSRAAMREEGRWFLTGPEFAHGEISHGSVLYSSGLRFFRHNDNAWKVNEPGDWNLWRRLYAAGVRIGWLDELTYYHY